MPTLLSWRMRTHMSLPVLSCNNIILTCWKRIGNLENSSRSSCTRRGCLHKYPKVIPPDKQLSISITCQIASIFAFMWQIHGQLMKHSVLAFLCPTVSILPSLQCYLPVRWWTVPVIMKPLSRILVTYFSGLRKEPPELPKDLCSPFWPKVDYIEQTNL